MGDLSWALKNGEIDKVKESIEVQVRTKFLFIVYERNYQTIIFVIPSRKLM